MQKTLKRLEEKIAGKVLNQILYSMNCSDPVMQHRTATALARLARENDLKTVFVDRKGLDILLNILTDPSRDAICHKEAAGLPPSVTVSPHQGDSQDCFMKPTVWLSSDILGLCPSSKSLEIGSSITQRERCKIMVLSVSHMDPVDA